MAQSPDPKKLDPAGLDRAMAALRDAVRERGLKVSTVRDAIARAALRRTGHFTVDDLVRDLRSEDSKDAHMTTVYRVLPLLVEVGLLQQSLLTTGDEAHYERAFEREHHDHLICTGCGMVVEFHFEALEALQRDIAARYEFELTDHVHELRGLCRQCKSERAS